MKKWLIGVGIVSLAILGVVVLTSAYANEGNFGWHGQKDGFGGRGDGNKGCFVGHSHGKGFGWQEHKRSDIASSFFHKAGFLMREKESMGLSEDQVQSIRNLKLEAVKSLIRNKADIKIFDLDIRSQLHQEKPDVAAIQKLIDSKYEAKKAFDKSMVDALVKLQAVPNDKQQEALKNLKKEHMKKMFGDKHHGDRKDSSGSNADSADEGSDTTDATQ